MIKVQKIMVGNLATNCYVVYDQNNNAVVIDAGADFDKINDFIKQNNLNVVAILLTHGHYDHIGACCNFVEKNVPIYIHENDADKCLDNNLNLSNKYNEDGGINTFKPSNVFDGEENEFAFGDIKVQAIHTAGHSEGSVSYIIENYLFSGDTIFENGYGRTDFYDGSGQKLRNSIRKLMPYIKGGYFLCAGH